MIYAMGSWTERVGCKSCNPRKPFKYLLLEKNASMPYARRPFLFYFETRPHFLGIGKKKGAPKPRVNDCDGPFKTPAFFN